MALDGVDFSIENGPEWGRVESALSDVSATLATEIHDAVTDMVNPWAAEAEARVSSMPIKGVGRQTGLRAEVAAGVNKSDGGTPEDFTVEVTASLPPGVGEENEGVIPMGLDRLSGWRHPVFGNRNNWVQQIPLVHGWFSGTFDNKHDDVENEIQGKLEAARDKIIAAGA